MRLKEYSELPVKNFSDFLAIYSYIQPINELSDESFNTVKKLGKKLGFKVKRSDSLFKYLKRAGKGINDLFRTAVIFGMTDVTNKKLQKKLIGDAKKTLGSMDKKEVTAFLMQLDRGTIGITAHIRHILMSFFGVEIATYNQWKSDIEYLEHEAEKIQKKLQKMGLDNSQEMELVQKFKNLVTSTYETE
jgi:hypothetical protein